MKVIFISPYPTQGPSYRYRVEQYFNYLEGKGIQCVARPFMNSQFYNIAYRPKNITRKLIYFLLASISRCWDFIQSFRYDIIFIHLEAYPLGPPVLEFLWSKFGKTIIYDLDDAIFLRNKKPAYKIVKFFKFGKKVESIIRFSKEIVVCNQYLKDYATKFKEKSKIHIIPTSLDTDKFLPLKNTGENRKEPVIGWIGSHSTAAYLNELTDVFRSLKKEHDFVLKIVGSNFSVQIEGIKIINKEWRLEDDLNDFQSLDIGVYPLPDNEWTKGKTGFKTIQYMSVGIPCVVSNVGRNKEIIQDGINGFLADNKDEWLTKLSLLIENPQLRSSIGARGRETVIERYSLKVNAPILLEIILKGYNERHAR